MTKFAYYNKGQFKIRLKKAEFEKVRVFMHCMRLGAEIMKSASIKYSLQKVLFLPKTATDNMVS